MKKSLLDSQITEKIIHSQKEMGGIFLTADLYHLLGARNPINNQRAIDRLVASGLLIRIMRGIYILKNFDPFLLASRLMPKSYISMDTVLIRNGLVGTLNPSNISCVTSRPRAKSYQADEVRVAYHSVDEKLFFGFEKQESGICWADNEKAYLDLMYFHLRGSRFPFDPKNEIRIDKLNLNKLRSYLKKYKNPKFRTFIEGQIYE